MHFINGKQQEPKEELQLKMERALSLHDPEVIKALKIFVDQHPLDRSVFYHSGNSDEIHTTFLAFIKQPDYIEIKEYLEKNYK